MDGRVHSLLYIDLGDVLSRVEERYSLALPRRVFKASYNKRTRTLLIRFRRGKPVYEDVTWDGLVTVYYGGSGGIVAVEVLDVAEL